MPDAVSVIAPPAAPPPAPQALKEIPSGILNAPPKTDAPAAPAPEAPKAPEPPKPDPRDEAFKMREREYVKQKQQFAADKAKWEQDRANEKKAHEAELREAAELKRTLADAKRNPDAALKALGVTYDEIKAFKEGGGKLTPELVLSLVDEQMRERDKKAAQDAERAAADAAAQQKVAYDAAIQRLHEDARAFVSKAPDEYELTREMKASSMVAEVIRESANGPRLLSFEEASAATEKRLRETAADLFKTKWFLDQYQPKSSAPAATAAPTPPAAPSRAVGENLAATTPPARKGGIPSLEERIKAAQAELDRINRGGAHA